MTKDIKAQLNKSFDELNLQAKNVEYFEEYIKILLLWNKKINLISKKEENIVQNLIAPSLLFFKHFTLDNYNIIDLGSGSGIPAVVLKIYKPSLNITMVDANYKKTTFLQYICRKLNLDCKIINNTFEAINKNIMQYNITTTRGVNIDTKLLGIIKQNIQSRWLVYFTSPNIHLPLNIQKELRLSLTAMKIYNLL